MSTEMARRLTSFAACAGCAGKIPVGDISRIVTGLPQFDDPNLIVGTEGFSDAGVYRLRDDLYIAQTLDFFPPLVDDPFTFGQIAATNALSDVYAMGARPTTALNIVCFPDKDLPLEILGRILAGGADRVIEAGAVVVGGHSLRDTEIKFGMSVTGTVTPDRLLTNQRARPGDVLILTKALGTGIITTANKADDCPSVALQAAIHSMTQLNRIGCDAADFGIHGATDITGFGLAGHGCELAQASRVSLMIDVDQLPLLPGAYELLKQGYKTRANASNRAHCEPMLRIQDGLDPLLVEMLFDAQTSGGLLLSVPPSAAPAFLQRAHAMGYAAAKIIGRVDEYSGCAVAVADSTENGE